jgi:hypothetical protein
VALPAEGKPPEGAKVLFYALPVASGDGAKTTAPLFAWTHNSSGRRRYAVGAESPGKDYQRAEAPLCHVWQYPLSSGIRFD